jgi:signal transduction histidine kinase
VVAHIFEPFYTTKAAGKGTGLGLALVQSIADQNRCALQVESAPGKGSTFRLLLPRA